MRNKSAWSALSVSIRTASYLWKTLIGCLQWGMTAERMDLCTSEEPLKPNSTSSLDFQASLAMSCRPVKVLLSFVENMHGTHLLHPCSSISVTHGLPLAPLEQSRSAPLKPTVAFKPRTQSAYSTGGGGCWRKVVGDSRLAWGVVVVIEELHPQPRDVSTSEHRAVDIRASPRADRSTFFHGRIVR